MQHSLDRQTSIEPNKVRQRKRTHGVAHTKSEGHINMFGGGNTLFENHDGLIEHGHEDGIGDEAGGVCRVGDLYIACELTC